MYLGPEIPSLSATFIYNEIFQARKLGYEIKVASVHKPAALASQRVQKELGDVTYIYNAGVKAFFTSFIKLLFTAPTTMFSTLANLVKDVIKLGLFNSLAVGQCYRFLASCFLADVLKKERIAHLHTHFAHVPTDIAMYAANIAGIPYSVTAHANDIFERGYLLNEKINRSKFFATISEYNKCQLANYDKANKLKVIRCGVDELSFVPRSHDPENKTPKIGVLARLVEKKGIHVLIDACAKLPNRDFIVEIAGDGPEKQKLELQAKQLNLQKQIKFLGQMDNHNVANWLDTIDFYALPCVVDKNGDMDGIPVSLMEAMLKGVPVITADVSGVAELVIDNQTGFIAKSADIDDLTCKIETAFSMNSDEKLNLKENAKQHVLKHFSMKANAQRLMNTINE